MYTHILHQTLGMPAIVLKDMIANYNKLYYSNLHFYIVSPFHLFSYFIPHVYFANICTYVCMRHIA